jgi:GH25 family lysozyme M1 (1,4-beta-N-acetylmuramidase)
MDRPNIRFDEYVINGGKKVYRSHPDISNFAHIGVDVSKHNGDVDFRGLKAAGVEFVIIRAGYGRSISQKDVRFEENYKKAKEAGMDVGVYWYSYAESITDAEKEAEVCLEVIKGKTFEYPIYYDVEEAKQFKIGKIFITNIINAFNDKIEAAGYFAGLYMSTYYMNEYVDAATQKKYALWIAQYGSKCTYKGVYGMWQFSDVGRFTGVNDHPKQNTMDVDASFVDYPSLIKGRGLNGYKKEEPKTDISSTETDKPVTEEPKYNYNIVVSTFDDKDKANKELLKVKLYYPEAKILKTYKK